MAQCSWLEIVQCVVHYFFLWLYYTEQGVQTVAVASSFTYGALFLASDELCTRTAHQLHHLYVCNKFISAIYDYQQPYFITFTQLRCCITMAMLFMIAHSEAKSEGRCCCTLLLAV